MKVTQLLRKLNKVTNHATSIECNFLSNWGYPGIQASWRLYIADIINKDFDCFSKLQKYVEDVLAACKGNLTKEILNSIEVKIGENNKLIEESEEVLKGEEDLTILTNLRK